MRFKALDSWRGICAIIVVLFHFPVAGPLKQAWLITHGYLFVDFFFVLSGFVIAKAYEERLTEPGEAVQFIIRRIGRLWPLHVAMLAFFVAVSAIQGDIGGNDRHSVWAIFTNLLMIHGLGIHGDLTWNGPSWSISVEFLLYLMFAALTLSSKRTVAYVGLVVGSVAVLAFWAPSGMGSTFDFGLFRGLAGFFTGALLARAPLRQMGTVAELLTVALVAVFVSSGMLQILSPFVFGWAVYVFAGSDGAVTRFLNRKPMLTLGDWSYSIYLTHTVFVAAIWTLRAPLGLTSRGSYLVGWSWQEQLAGAALYVLLVIGLSAITYRWIELPGKRYFNGLAVSWSAKGLATT